MTSDILINVLKKAGYRDYKQITAKKFFIYTGEDRLTIIHQIKRLFRGVYDPTPSSDCSMGGVKIKDFTIYVKPNDKQGENRPGIKNETIIIKEIKRQLRKHKKINVRFYSDKKSFVYKNIVDIKHTGTIVSAGQKADMVISDHTGKLFCFSIKKDNAEMWGSADKWAPKAKKHIIKLHKKGKVKFYKKNGLYHLYPKIAIEANSEESNRYIFGSDIKNNGLVITRTFEKNNMVFKGNTLHINCTHIIQNLRDVDKKHRLWFHVRTDKCRTTPDFFKGLRIMASYEVAIGSTILRVKTS
jgi:hypothetical protein